MNEGTEKNVTTGNSDEANFKCLPTDKHVNVLLEHCKFVQYCRDNITTLSESEFIAMVTNVSRCQSGPETVHKLASLYPQYSVEKANQKILHALNNMNPTTCEYIRNSLDFEGCPSEGCGIKAPCGFVLSNKVISNYC
ncbi:hypothetical protein Ga0466249_005341 [Sporomusaceae bacterium BoRhaA]|uniref:hypothetical protein n=1 Tax=Pelorhabdus rhamnosifermentans TaxID=2772457 RepID=UPI001C060A9F|nr:hypothetical protein [Pelorhabdus rhamnosifermentans]MBU2704187.1 hypothetical protein [Pelorhabdus rhamnosifermentans]